MPEMIKRSQLAEYLDVTPNGSTRTWERIGFGVEGKSTDYAPEIDERQFIDADAPTATLKRYGMTSDFPIIAATGSPVFEYLDKLRIKRAIYADAESSTIEVRLYEPIDGETGAYAATMTPVTVVINSSGDAAEDPFTLEATLSGRGDPVQGTFAYATKTFTANP